MFEYELPDVGEGVAEGEIVAWHVEPGETVVEDQVLAEVETDKAVVDLPSPVDGVIVELHAEEGDIVPVGSVVVTIDTDGENGDGVDEAGQETEDTRPTDDTEDAPPDEQQPADEDWEFGSTESTPQQGEATDVQTRVFAPPHVRRLARELDVDIHAVDGSGPGGRITETDVRSATETEASTDAESRQGTTAEGEQSDDGKATQRTPAVRRRSESTAGNDTGSTSDPEHPDTVSAGQGDPVEPADREQTLAAPATRSLASELGVDINAVPTTKTRDGQAFVEPEDVRAFASGTQTAGAKPTATDPSGTDTAGEAVSETGQPIDALAARTEPYRGIRRTIGNRMAQSAFTAPHVTHHDTAVVPDLVEARERLIEDATDRGTQLTYLPFILKAVTTALADYPAMNAELDEEAEEIRYWDRYDIGVAVATDAGLMVPVVERVPEKGLLDLATEVQDLADRARRRELEPSELRGSTFTITNFGAIGGEYATPILNYPETGILGLGRLEERPVAENGAVVAEPTLPLSLSIDHRVVDGAIAARFCNDVKRYLEHPMRLLL